MESIAKKWTGFLDNHYPNPITLTHLPKKDKSNYCFIKKFYNDCSDLKSSSKVKLAASIFSIPTCTQKTVNQKANGAFGSMRHEMNKKNIVYTVFTQTTALINYSWTVVVGIFPVPVYLFAAATAATVAAGLNCVNSCGSKHQKLEKCSESLSKAARYISKTSLAQFYSVPRAVVGIVQKIATLVLIPIYLTGRVIANCCSENEADSSEKVLSSQPIKKTEKVKIIEESEESEESISSTEEKDVNPQPEKLSPQPIPQPIEKTERVKKVEISEEVEELISSTEEEGSRGNKTLLETVLENYNYDFESECINNIPRPALHDDKDFMYREYSYLACMLEAAPYQEECDFYLEYNREHIVLETRDADRGAAFHLLKTCIEADRERLKNSNSSATCIPYKLVVGYAHTTLVFVDLKKKTLEYYNSFGSYDSFGKLDLSLSVLRRIAAELGLKFEVKVERCIQSDSSLCGYWVPYFLKKRLETPDFNFNKISDPTSVITNYKETLNNEIHLHNATIKHRRNKILEFYEKTYGKNLARRKVLEDFRTIAKISPSDNHLSLVRCYDRYIYFFNKPKKKIGSGG